VKQFHVDVVNRHDALFKLVFNHDYANAGLLLFSTAMLQLGHQMSGVLKHAMMGSVFLLSINLLPYFYYYCCATKASVFSKNSLARIKTTIYFSTNDANLFVIIVIVVIRRRWRRWFKYIVHQGCIPTGGFTT
jgi:hypothetical protein